MEEFLNRMLGRAAAQWANWRFERSCKQVAAMISAVDDDDDGGHEARLAHEPREQRDGMACTAEYVADVLPQLRVQSGLPEPTDPALVSAWRRLPTRQRRLLLLYEARGLTCRQFARRLALSD